ncbi:hypothetical protein MNB_SV-14-1793 [hydrothermal vent metagenome]|uniref:Uncharacterized protein n=1 Tax=hydrothermal vent metagenome TaxID=652676 RepID=A0A1W1CKH6_9ZZZZ
MNLKLKKVEKLILEYLKARPFHNLFMLHDIQIKGSKIGGTCSEMTIEFKEILEKMEKRFSNKSIYPFDGKLLYSFIHEDTFYLIRGDKKFVYKA